MTPFVVQKQKKNNKKIAKGFSVSGQFACPADFFFLTVIFKVSLTSGLTASGLFLHFLLGAIMSRLCQLHDRPPSPTRCFQVQPEAHADLEPQPKESIY